MGRGIARGKSWYKYASRKAIMIEACDQNGCHERLSSGV